MNELERPGPTEPNGSSGSLSTRALSSLRYCLLREHLLWTGRIAAIMGVLYTVVNQADVIVSGQATTALALKIPLNFIAPFVVANVGLLGARAKALG